MTPLEILFIRACKSTNPTVRLISLYKRFYTRSASMCETQETISFILCSIIDKCNPMKSAEIFHVLNSDIYIGATIKEKMLNAMKNRIRFTDVAKFPGYKAPKRWKQ